MPYKVKQEGSKWRVEIKRITGWHPLPGHYNSKKSATNVIRKLYAVEHNNFPSGKKKR